MRKPVLIIGALAAAGFVAFAGGSAFTDSNTLPPTAAGYGTTTATGATVDTVHYVPSALNSGTLSSITFHTSTDFSTLTYAPTATVSLTHTGAAYGTWNCVTTDLIANGNITCDTSVDSADGTPVTGGAVIASFDGTALTVVS